MDSETIDLSPVVDLAALIRTQKRLAVDYMRFLETTSTIWRAAGLGGFRTAHCGRISRLPYTKPSLPVPNIQPIGTQDEHDAKHGFRRPQLSRSPFTRGIRARTAGFP